MERLTPGDRQIIQKAKGFYDKDGAYHRPEPNVFTNFYLRTPNTGTWWRPGAETDHWRVGYERLLKRWRDERKPEEFKYNNKTYVAELNHDQIHLYPGQPAFFDNHGLMMLPWAVDVFRAPQEVTTIVGGFGSGKTMNMVMMQLVLAATIPNYTAFLLSPLVKQVTHMFNLASRTLVAGTQYERRFITKVVHSPPQKIVISHEGIGESYLEFHVVHNGSAGMRTLEADAWLLDQAELVPDLQSFMIDMSTRLRGIDVKTGRERLGRGILMANSAANDGLWDIFDKAEMDPESYLSLQPSSFDNLYLTDRDKKRYMREAGADEQMADQWLHGKRPIGDGKHFSAAVLQDMTEDNLDRVMEQGLRDNIPGYVFEQTSGIGVHTWMLPPVPGHQYVVISDPGTANPPNRDSPVILVFDITGFPYRGAEPVPAKLTAFRWVFGGKDINNWATAYADTVYRYNAIASNGIDATGFQAGYDKWLSLLEGLYPMKISLTGQSKWEIVNAGKTLAARRLIKLPRAVRPIYDQLSFYDYPEPKHMRQDIVMTFVMACWWLMMHYNLDPPPGNEMEMDPLKRRGVRNRASRVGGYRR